MTKTKKKKPAAKPDGGSTQAVRQVPGSWFEKIPIAEGLLVLGPLFLLGVSPLIFYGQAGEFENVPKMAILQWGIILLSLVRIWHFKQGAGFTWKISALDIPILLFYALCWISLIKAPNISLASLPLLHYAASILFYFFLLNTLPDGESIDRYFFTLTLSIMAVSAVGICQYLFNFAGVPQIVPPASTLSNKNMATHIISMSLPLCVGCLVLAGRLWKSIISGASIFLTLLYLLYTKTRAGWLAALVVFTLMGIACLPRLKALVQKQSRQKLLTASAVAVIFLVLLVVCSRMPSADIPVPMNKESIQERFFSMTDTSGGDSAQLRIIWWKNTLHMVKDYLWWGTGLQNFKIFYPLYHRAADLDWSFTDEHQLTRVHNDHLQMLVELGIFGFAAYAAMFGIFFWMFGRIYFRSRDDRIKLRALFICLGVVGFIINAAFCFPMERALPPVYLFSFFALMGVLYRESFPAPLATVAVRRHILLRSAISLVLLVFLLVSVYVIRRVMLSDKYFVEAIIDDQKGSIEKSSEALKKAKIFSLYNSNISALLARNYALQGNFQQAIEEYKETFRAHPNNTSAILNTGYCYLQLRKFDEAEKYFKWAINLMPSFEQAYNDLGIVYYSQQKFDQAIAQYQKAIEINKDYPEPHINLGNLYRSLKRTEQAIQEYENALRIKPNQPETRQWLCGLYMERGQYEKAQAVLKPLLQNTAAPAAENYVMQGNIYQRQGQHAQALAEYEKAFRLKPQNPLICYNIGLSHYYLQNYAAAADYFRKTLAFNPNIAEAYNMLGQLTVLKKDDTAALELFQKAVAINPKLKDAQFNLGTLYLRIGDLDSAAKAYQDTLAADPNHTLAHYNLGAIYMEKGNNEKALFHFQQALKNPSSLIDVKTAEKFIIDLKTKTPR